MATLANVSVEAERRGGTNRSARSFSHARTVFPDGTSRVTIERDPVPRYMDHGEGAYLFDVDGNRFLDLNGNFTTLIHGHGFRPVVEAVQRQVARGSCFASPTESEVELAEILCDRIPAVENVRFVNTGTEAVMFAIKAARAFTGKSGIAKFEGAYHGAYDIAEVSQASIPEDWGAKEAPRSTPFYRGMPKSVLDETVVLRFNDAELVAKRLAERASDIAAVLIDPMPSRAGLIAPNADFLEALHKVCQDNGILIIADEVLNLRQGYQGASARHGVRPDLVAMGKIIGGGLPIGAIGGRKEIMQVFSADNGRPLLPQGGTFSANPLSMVAGAAAMRALDKAAFEHLDRLGNRLRTNLRDVIRQHDAPFSVTGAGSLFRIHPSRAIPQDYRDTYTSSSQHSVLKNLTRFFGSKGVILPNAAAACLSTPMRDDEIDLVSGIFNDFLHRHSAEVSAMESI